jgi:uncharacterized radical SAM superfamily protein
VVDAGLAVVPHVVVGLHFGQVQGEDDALAMAARYPITALAIVVVRPLPTAGARKRAPCPEEVARVLARARLALPTRPLLLGCARPVGDESRAIEAYALRAGVNGIAFPADQTVQLARALGLCPRPEELCCAFSALD